MVLNRYGESIMAARPQCDEAKPTPFGGEKGQTDSAGLALSGAAPPVPEWAMVMQDAIF